MRPHSFLSSQWVEHLPYLPHLVAPLNRLLNPLYKLWLL